MKRHFSVTWHLTSENYLSTYHRFHNKTRTDVHGTRASCQKVIYNVMYFNIQYCRMLNLRYDLLEAIDLSLFSIFCKPLSAGKGTRQVSYKIFILFLCDPFARNYLGLRVM